jgi:hypothetical protein
LTASNYPNCSGFTSNASGLIQCTASDQRLKQGILPLGSQSGLAAINALSPVSFYWQDPTRGTAEQFGFIAQQVQQIFPNLVSTTTATALTPGGTLTLNYDGLISPLILATQELSASSTAIQNSIDVLQSQISNLQSSLGGNVSSNNLTVYLPSNFSGDSVGEAEIPAGQTSVRVSFSQPYAYQPIVTFSPEGAFVPAFILEKDNAGFTLGLQTATTSSITLDWHSFASPQEQLTVSGGSIAPVVLVQPPVAASANATPLAVISAPFDSPTSTPELASSTPPDTSGSSSPSTVTDVSTSTEPSALPSPTASPISSPTPTPSPTPSPVVTATPSATPVVASQGASQTPDPAVTPVPSPTQTVSQPASPTPSADSQDPVENP